MKRLRGVMFPEVTPKFTAQLCYKVEVALLSELEFKHQVTTARGGGGGHESTEVPGCPEDRKRDGGKGTERCSGE